VSFSNEVDRLVVLGPVQADQPTLNQLRELLQAENIQYLDCDLSGLRWSLGSTYLMLDQKDTQRVLFLTQGEQLVEGEVTEFEGRLHIITEHMLVS